MDAPDASEETKASSETETLARKSKTPKRKLTDTSADDLLPTPNAIKKRKVRGKDKQDSNASKESSLSVERPTLKLDSKTDDNACMWTPHLGLFKTLIKALIDAGLNDINFFVSPNGVSAQAMDTSHVSLIEFSLSNKGFFDGTIQCKNDASFNLGLNLAAFQTCLAYLSHTQESLGLTMVARGEMLLLSVCQRTAKLKLLDLDVERMEVPEPTEETTVNMSAGAWKQEITKLKTIGDNLELSLRCDERVNDTKDQILLEKSSFVMMLRGRGDRADAAAELKSGSHFVVTQWGFDQFDAKYALKFLEMQCKTIVSEDAKTSRVELRLSPDRPLCLFYNIEPFLKTKKQKTNAEHGQKETENQNENETVQDEKEERQEGRREMDDPGCWLRFMLAPKTDEDEAEPKTSS